MTAVAKWLFAAHATGAPVVPFLAGLRGELIWTESGGDWDWVRLICLGRHVLGFVYFARDLPDCEGLTLSNNFEGSREHGIELYDEEIWEI